MLWARGSARMPITCLPYFERFETWSKSFWSSTTDAETSLVPVVDFVSGGFATAVRAGPGFIGVAEAGEGMVVTADEEVDLGVFSATLGDSIRSEMAGFWV